MNVDHLRELLALALIGLPLLAIGLLALTALFALKSQSRRHLPQKTRRRLQTYGG